MVARRGAKKSRGARKGGGRGTKKSASKSKGRGVAKKSTKKGGKKAGKKGLRVRRRAAREVVVLLRRALRSDPGSQQHQQAPVHRPALRATSCRKAPAPQEPVKKVRALNLTPRAKRVVRFKPR